MFPPRLLITKVLTRKFQYLTQQHILLRRIVDRIRNSLELNVVLQTAVDEIAALLEIDRCVFFWYFKDLQRVQIVCQHTSADHASYLGHYAICRFGAVAPLIENGELVNSPGSLPRPWGWKFLARWLRLAPQPSQPHLQILGASANLLVPVRGREGSIGFIACLADRPRRWSNAEVEFMQSIAQQLEIAIRQAQLYERTQKQAQREQLVNQITTQTRQSLNIETILTQAIAQLLNALEIDRCLVHLVENPEEPLVANATLADADASLFRRQHLFEVCRPPFPVTIAEFDTHGPITQWVIQNRQQVVISDITQDDRIGAHNREYLLAQIKSTLVVPVQANGTLQAILYLNQCSHIRYWSKDDQKLALAVADQLAVSIQQGHLYAKTRQQAAKSAAQAQHLAETLQNLQQTQAQLIQSEKMSSLGQMVAGVAHEINNPISFIYGNIPYLQQYTQDLLRLLEAYQNLHLQQPEALQALAQEVELDFLLQDLPRILNSMQLGAERIRAIVQSLRTFSRLDEAHYKVADIHAGLETTLFMLQHQLQPDIQVIRHYGDLPPVKCYPRLLNQVFLSLLMNAIEALQQSDRPVKTITLTTTVTMSGQNGEKWVQIRIADNGCGIPYSVQPKIFDPFFTTKKIGQGAGLGLAVSYQSVVNQHQGHLRFASQPGQGTEFTVEIPAQSASRLTRQRHLYLPKDSLISQEV